MTLGGMEVEQSNPRPWRAEATEDGWYVIDARGQRVAVVNQGTYESDKAAAQLIVDLANQEARP